MAASAASARSMYSGSVISNFRHVECSPNSSERRWPRARRGRPRRPAARRARCTCPPIRSPRNAPRCPACCCPRRPPAPPADAAGQAAGSRQQRPRRRPAQVNRPRTAPRPSPHRAPATAPCRSKAGRSPTSRSNTARRCSSTRSNGCSTPSPPTSAASRAAMRWSATPIKANSSLGVLRVFAEAGCGFDIVSGGELARVLAAGADPAKVIFSGVGKTRAEMRQALAAGIGCFNVESEAELDVLNAVALEEGRRAARRASASTRTSTRRPIPTSRPASRATSSASPTTARSPTYRHAAALQGLQVVGIDCHIGSQITDASPYLEALERVLDLVEAIEAAGIPAAPPRLRRRPGHRLHRRRRRRPPRRSWQQLLARIDARGFGQPQADRRAGPLAGRQRRRLRDRGAVPQARRAEELLHRRCRHERPARPAMYQAFHQHRAAARERATCRPRTYDVVGPVCEAATGSAATATLPAGPATSLAVLSARRLLHGAWPATTTRAAARPKCW